MTEQQVYPRVSTISSRRDMAASQVWHSGEGFSPWPSRASRCGLPFSGDYRAPLICRPKRPTPVNDRVKSNSGAAGSGSPRGSWSLGGRCLE